MANLLIYFNNFSSLGHSTIVFSLIQSLKRRFNEKIDITVIENGISRVHDFPFGNYCRSYFIPLFSDMTLGSARLDRKNRYLKLKKIADKCKPDVLITEFFPFCKSENNIELPLFLSYLKQKFQTKVISSCTYLTWTDQTLKNIDNFYDMLLLHFPKEFAKDCLEYLPAEGVSVINKVFSNYSERIVFTGFFLKRNKSNTANKLREKLICVSTGGLKNFQKIAISAISAARSFKDHRFAIFNDSVFRECKKHVGNVELFKVRRDIFEEYLRSSELSINMAGYNTMVKLLFYRKRSIIIPKIDTEQIRNAKILSYLLPCRIMNYNEIDARSLAENISYLSTKDYSKCSRIKRSWFYGLEKTVELISTFLC